MLVVILGPDRALSRRALDEQLARIDAGELSIDRIEASASSLDGLLAAVTAVPFFGSQRVVVVSGLLGQTDGKGNRGSRAKSGSDVARLISAAPGTTHLILYEPDMADLSASVRKQIPSGAAVLVNEAPRGHALVELAQRLATEQHSSMDRTSARLLLDRLFPAYWPQAPLNRAFDKPPSVDLLESEIAKLALAAFPEPIGADIIEEMVPQRSDERIFPLLDAIVGGNQRVAVQEIDNARRAGEDPSRSMAQIYQQIELAVAVMASGRPRDAVQAGRALGLTNANRMKPVEKAAQHARIAPARQLQLALRHDRKLKTGRLRNPEEGLLELAIGIAGASENR